MAFDHRITGEAMGSFLYRETRMLVMVLKLAPVLGVATKTWDKSSTRDTKTKKKSWLQAVPWPSRLFS